MLDFKPCKPSIIIQTLRPVIDQPLSMEWSAVPFADFYQITFIKQDEDRGAIGTETRTVSQTQNTYNYEDPNVKRIEVKIKACNGPACGIDWTSGMINYIDAVVITQSSVDAISQSYRQTVSHQIRTNKDSESPTFSIPNNQYSWLYIDSATGILTDNGALTSADVGTKTFDVKVEHEGTGTTDTKQMQIIVIETCGNGTVDTGEACDPEMQAIKNYSITPGGNSVTLRCIPSGETNACQWQPDRDNDGISGETDCQNQTREPNMYIGSSHQGLTRVDYNCNNNIDIAPGVCVQGSGPRFGTADVCPGANQSQADSWCKSYFGHQDAVATVLGSGGDYCNGVREIECSWCEARQNKYY